ncbi:MAG: hypothetical protein ABIT36_09265 [Steroidobacteraceae bacterium]
MLRLMDEPEHRSLETEFFAVVPPRRASWHRRLFYWSLVKLLRFRIVRAILL